MPRLEHLENLHTNRTYAVNANLKYLHRGQKSMTGILEQDNHQSKFCIRNKEVNMDQGYGYAFDRCFNSNNGWLYVRDPKNSIHQKEQSIAKQPLQLKKLFQERNNLMNKYISVALFVAKLNPKKTFVKHEQNLTLDTLTCFGNGVLIDVNIWNQNIPNQVQGKWVLFDGFKIKFTGPDSMSLTSSVYSKMQFILSPGETEQYNSENENTYKNLSNLYQNRTITEIHALSQINEKLFSHIKANVTDIKQFSYEGCSDCKKKLVQGKCVQCGQEVMLTEYKYLGLELNDGEGVIYGSVFDGEIQKKLNELNMQNTNSFEILLKTKSDLSREVPKISHVIIKMNPLAN